MTRRWTALAIGGLMIVTVSNAPLLAHHSFAVYYLDFDGVLLEVDQREGVVSQDRLAEHHRRSENNRRPQPRHAAS